MKTSQPGPVTDPSVRKLVRVGLQDDDRMDHTGSRYLNPNYPAEPSYGFHAGHKGLRPSRHSWTPPIPMRLADRREVVRGDFATSEAYHAACEAPDTVSAFDVCMSSCGPDKWKIVCRGNDDTVFLRVFASKEKAEHVYNAIRDFTTIGSLLSRYGFKPD